MKTIICNTISELRNAKYELRMLGIKFEIIDLEDAWEIRY